MKPRSLFLTDENMALAVDLYELTMAAAYFDNDVNFTSTFDLFVRKLPPNRGYLIAAGLEQAVYYLLNLRFSPAQVKFLREHPIFRNVSDGFFEYLRLFRFTGDLRAIPEGELVFPDEPILSITAPIIQAQIVETYLLSVINYQTMVATKASRVVLAARGRGVVDFGSRRAHGPQAGVLAARASYIGGCTGTSNVLAGYELGIPIVGTVAHSWNMTFDDELESFHAYHRVFPDNTVLLIDTYDTVEGAKKAIKIGPDLKGVRIDSGDLLGLSRKVREILDSNGMEHVKIIASGDLNEYKVDELLRNDAPIDLFGVGTEMVTSRDEPTLSAVYKLVEQELGQRRIPKMKLSDEKVTYPGRKQVYRQRDDRGKFKQDVICCKDEELEGEGMMVDVIREGELCYDLPPIERIRERAMKNLADLPEGYKRLIDPDRYPVLRSDELETLKRQTERKILRTETADG
jgi:nicotinate phosphoribosyltransferase